MVRTTRIGMACVLSAAVLAAACQRAQSVDDANKPPEPLRLEAPQEVQEVQKQANAPVTDGKKATAATKPTPAPSRPAAPKSAPLTLVNVDAAPVKTPAIATREAAPEANTPAPDAAPKRNEDEPIVTTISGCLERDRSRFRLTDMIGEHAPKSRSWKTGFFRKGSAKLDLVDETNGLKLMPHVGYRVDVTGSLFKKAMHAQSVSPTSARCS